MEIVRMRDTPAYGANKGDYGRLADISNLFKLVAGSAVVQKSASYTLLPTDSGKCFHDLTNAITLTFPSTLPIGWWCVVKHVANTTLTLSGSSATINGAASLAADNTQDPTATALIVKTSTGDFSAFLIGTWA
jgi:hypothetical protein